jgi:hypothetical protein
MAITRKLLGIEIGMDAMAADGTFIVTARALVTDDVEGTSNPASKVFNAPAVRQAAQTLLDTITTLATNAGKPITF